ncbi:MAG: hypothetical protein ACE5H7_12970 [Acidiferrobacterales bacterium]
MTKQTREVHVPQLARSSDDVMETEEVEEFHSGHEVQPADLPGPVS